MKDVACEAVRLTVTFCASHILAGKSFRQKLMKRVSFASTLVDLFTQCECGVLALPVKLICVY